MDIKKLQAKIEILNKKIRPKYRLYTQEEKEILAKTVKLNEEVGELCNDILAILQLQRKAKLQKFQREHIHQEFADVLIVTMQLASLTKVDMENAVLEKLKKVANRYRRELNSS